MGLLEGKTALITGVANKMSIAWAIAGAFRKEGAEIALCCLESNLRRVSKIAREMGIGTVVPCDVRNDDDITRVFSTIGTVFDGKLDILVHSIAYAQIEDLGGEFLKVLRSGWNLALEISAYSLVAFCREARPLMAKSNDASIMTLTFGGGERVTPGYNIMGVAKAALNMSIMYLAYDLGPDRIRVNGISSGPIRTLSSLMVEDFASSLNLMEEQSPLLRNITLEDVSGTAVYLASALSSGVTASIIKVEGGMSGLLAPSITHPRRKAGLKQNDSISIEKT